MMLVKETLQASQHKCILYKCYLWSNYFILYFFVYYSLSNSVDYLQQQHKFTNVPDLLSKQSL